MDDLTMLKTAGVSTTGIAILLIVYRLFKSIQGKRLVSSCCGKRLEVGIQVENMTPQVVVHNPMLERDTPQIRTPTATVATDTGSTHL